VKKRSKATLCKVAADKRLEATGFTYKCGPKGLKGLRNRFVSEIIFFVFLACNRLDVIL
jgi:hypothetical protein